MGFVVVWPNVLMILVKYTNISLKDTQNNHSDLLAILSVEGVALTVFVSLWFVSQIAGIQSQQIDIIQFIYFCDYYK